MNYRFVDRVTQEIILFSLQRGPLTPLSDHMINRKQAKEPVSSKEMPLQL